MNATELLRHDHRAIEGLLARALRPGAASRRSLFLELKRVLGDHIRLEEEVFYPAVKGTPSPEAAASLGDFLDGHLHAASALEELSAMRPGGRRFGRKLDQLRAGLERHFRDEERGLFEEARRRLPGRRLEELGAVMAARRARAWPRAG
jgi:iron-sulfur cluster repair protein YtfE (RIC family)